MTETTKREAIEACLGPILQRSDFPALAEHIQELASLAEDAEGPLRYVTQVVLKDMGLALRLLRSANSTQYNRSGRPILTVAHAVTLLGMEAVRDLALSLLLFKHYQTRAPGTRPLMLLSLLSANHAREAAAEVGYPKWEEAYLCGMFRNLGEVLIACYCPTEYSSVLLEMKTRKCAERPACRKVLGFTYEELGSAALDRWKIPAKVGATLSDDVPAGPGPLEEDALLHALTAFSHDLTMAIHREEPDSARSRIKLLMQTYGPSLGLRQEQVEKIADRALRETKATFDTMKIPVDELRLRKVTEAALAERDAPPVAEGPATDSRVYRDSEAPPAAEPPAPLLAAMAQEIEAVVFSDAFHLNEVLLMVLEALTRGAGFDRALFCLVGADKKEVLGRMGLGENTNPLVAAFRFPLSRRTPPVAASLLAGVDLFVDDGRYEGTEFARVTAAPSFGLYPIAVDEVLVGCFYFDRRGPARALEPGLAAMIGRLRDLAATAIRRRR